MENGNESETAEPLVQKVTDENTGGNQVDITDNADKLTDNGDKLTDNGDKLTDNGEDEAKMTNNGEMTDNGLNSIEEEGVKDDRLEDNNNGINHVELLSDISSKRVTVTTSDCSSSMLAAAMTPTSPRSISTPSMSASDDMIENENKTLRDRVSYLEKHVHDQNDEITCLRATVADALRRINSLESGKEHVQVIHHDVRLRREHVNGGSPRTPGSANRRPVSNTFSHSGAEHYRPIHAAAISSETGLYQSTRSLHSDRHLSPAPSSPSPTHHYHSRSSTTPIRTGLRDGIVMPPPMQTRQKGLSGSMSNLTKKWSSTSDFRDQSPGPRRMPTGSMHSLRSPFGSQQNLNDLGFKHGTNTAVFNDSDNSVRMFLYGRPVTLFAPTETAQTYSVAKVSPAPHQKPKLEWVYGYRGKDARSNLYLLPTGEMVYFVAAVVVLFNAEEHAQRHYLGHTEDIKCLTVHPNKLLIASGQTSHDRREGKAHIRVWNSVSLQTLHVIGVGDFQRSVICLSFSKADGGNLLTAVDDGNDHIMSVWDWSRGERGTKITETKCATETVVAAEFHPLEAGVIVSIGKGHVNFWQIDSTSLTLSRKTGIFDTRDKPKYVTCLAFSYTGDVLTGDSNGNIFIWGRGYNAVTKALRKVHEGAIFSICVLKDGSIVTGGGKDRKLVQFDAMYKKTGMEAELPEHLGSIRTISQGKGNQLLLGSTRNSILQGTFDLSFHEIVSGHVDEVWALAAHPQQNQFISAGYDNHIHLWDTLTHRAVWSSHLDDPAQSVCFSSTGDVIVVGMMTGKWIALDSQTREIFAVHQDGNQPIQIVRFSPSDRLLVLGSRDGIIYVYQVQNGGKKFNRVGRCMGHSSPVTHMDWSIDGNYLQSTSRECELLFWNPSICRQVTTPASLRDVTWSTQSCLVGFNTVGVWPENADGTDLNTCARSNNEKFLATGDDCGKIRLYSYPASQPKCLFHRVVGHGSRVTQLSFLPDDSRLISAGGRDTAIMQWKILN